jgi:type II secretory pathway component GspD/PulD (secretin)
MRFFAAAALFLLAQGMPVTRLGGGMPAEGSALPPAAQPPVLPGMPVTQVDPGAAAATLDSARRLSLAFSEPRPVQEVLRLLVAGTPFSLSIDPDVSGAFRGELKQLTLRDALTTLLAPLGDEFEVRGTVLRITHNRAETRAFDVNLLAVQRGLTRTTGSSGATITTTVAAEDVFAGVGDGVQALLSPSGTVHVDRRAGLVQVTDSAERLDRVEQYLEALQVQSGRQVRLQARVFEITLKETAAIDWRAVRRKLGMPPDAPDAGLATDPEALQAALASQGDIRVLSAPEVMALNNEPALVCATTPGVSALTLTVVPQIAADGMVQLSVSHSWEELVAGQKDMTVTQADTVTRVMDGRTVLIAGLLRPVQIAVASDGMGSQSGGQGKKTVQAELVVLLRATVVTAGYR